MQGHPTVFIADVGTGVVPQEQLSDDSVAVLTGHVKGCSVVVRTHGTVDVFFGNVRETQHG
jgi:hypothetical protein